MFSKNVGKSSKVTAKKLNKRKESTFRWMKYIAVTYSKRYFSLGEGIFLDIQFDIQGRIFKHSEEGNFRRFNANSCSVSINSKCTEVKNNWYRRYDKDKESSKGIICLCFEQKSFENNLKSFYGSNVSEPINSEW